MSISMKHIIFLSVGLLACPIIKSEPKKAKTTVVAPKKMRLPKQVVGVDKTEMAQLEKEKNLKSVNKVSVVIYSSLPSEDGGGDPIVLTEQELTRPGIDGKVRSKDDIINEKMMRNDALYYFKMGSPDDQVDSHIKSLQETYGISEDELGDLFKQSGMSFTEGKDQLLTMYAVNGLIDYTIKSRITVTEKDVTKYYNDHPEFRQASFEFKKGFIKEDAMDEKELNKLAQKANDSRIEWSGKYALDEDEISDSKKSITKMKIGDISQPEKVAGGFEVTQLVSKQPKVKLSLEERYASISDKLRAPQYEKMLAQYQTDMAKRYEIVHLS